VLAHLRPCRYACDRRQPPARHRSGGSVAMPELHFMAGGDFEIVQAVRVMRRYGKPIVA